MYLYGGHLYNKTRLQVPLILMWQVSDLICFCLLETPGHGTYVLHFEQLHVVLIYSVLIYFCQFELKRLRQINWMECPHFSEHSVHMDGNMRLYRYKSAGMQVFCMQKGNIAML